ncbi:MAG: hypothetical protein M3Y55_10805, partial [Pseudomonadota bacterium]|nr:hypothetical protein [Pseudomonadota bacterium]
MLIAVMVVISGCAAQVTTLKVPGIEKSAQTPLQDARPPMEKQGENFSLLITSDAYAIARVAETISTPTPIRLLQHRASETLQPQSSVKVLHLVVYRNSQSELRRSSIGAGLGGVIGAVIGGQSVTSVSGAKSSLADREAFDSAAPDEYKRALYTEAENSGRGSVLVIYVETEVNGKRIFTRTLAPLVAKEGESAYLNALESSFKYHLDQYVPGRDAATLAASQAAEERVISAAALASWSPGTRLIYTDSDVRTKVSQGETAFIVSEISPKHWVLNDGMIVSASDGTPEKGAMHGVLVYGVGPAQIARGGRWSGTFHVGGVFEDVPAQFTLLGKQPKVISGRRFNGARIRIDGFASRVYGGGVGTAGGSAFDGEMLV